MLPFDELAFFADQGLTRDLDRPRRLAATLLLALFAPACGPASPAPSWRADLAPGRHVLLIPPLAEHPRLIDHDGTALDGSTSEGGKPDLAWCARICAVVARPGERVIGCFYTPAEDLLLRLRVNGELFDCALARPASSSASIGPQGSR